MGVSFSEPIYSANGKYAIRKTPIPIGKRGSNIWSFWHAYKQELYNSGFNITKDKQSGQYVIIHFNELKPEAGSYTKDKLEFKEKFDKWQPIAEEFFKSKEEVVEMVNDLEDLKDLEFDKIINNKKNYKSKKH